MSTKARVFTRKFDNSCREKFQQKSRKLLALLMAQWVEMESEKSRTERMLVRDKPTLRY